MIKMRLFVNKTMLNKHIQAFKAIYAVFNAVLFGMLETGPTLCQCDDLHKLETFSKLYAFKSIEYNFPINMTDPVCKHPSFKIFIIFHLTT